MKKRVCNSRLKYERQLHNWSQQKVADMIGSTVGNEVRHLHHPIFDLSSVNFLTKMPLRWDSSLGQRMRPKPRCSLPPTNKPSMIQPYRSLL